MTIASSTAALVRRACTGLYVVATLLASLADGQSASKPVTSSDRPRERMSVADLTFAFVSNEGQWSTDARFVASGADLIVRADGAGFWLTGLSRSHPDDPASRAALRFEFAASSTQVQPTPEHPLPGTRNYFRGNDPSQWRTGLVGYSALRWSGVQPGVDFVLEASQSGHRLQYSLRCGAGTGERPLVLRLVGANRMWVDADGALVASTSIGELRQCAPHAWEINADGSLRGVATRFDLLSGDRFSIAIPGRDDSLALLVDPGLDWAGYIGGASTDLATDLVLTSADEPVVVGRTLSPDFPTTPGVVQPIDSPDFDAFVMKVSADGTSLLYASYVGGNDLDQGWSVALRPNGAAVLGGLTRSPDFPTTPGAFDTHLDAQEGFVLELRPDGSAIKFSTFIGGTTATGCCQDKVKALAVRTDGAVVVGGDTSSTDFPGVGLGAQSAFGGGPFDAFVAVVAPDGGSLLAASYLGGAGDESLADLALQDDGTVIVGGSTKGPGFPTTPGAFDTIYSPISPTLAAGFVAHISQSLSSVAFATYLDAAYGAVVHNVAAAASGNVVVVGTAGSADFPTTSGAFDTTFNGSGANGYVAKLAADGSALLFCSYDGSAGDSDTAAVSMSAAGVITIGGSAFVDPFPATPGAFDSTIGTLAFPDAYVMRFKPDGSGLLYATLLGEPSGFEASFNIALDSHGRAVVLGNVISDSIPTTPGSFDPTYGGGPSGGYDEGFLARLEMQPLGVAGYGSPTPACLGPIRLTALGEPKAGNSVFAIACVGAPPGALGFLGVGVAGLDPALPIAGIGLHVDVTQPYLVLGASADPGGYDEVAAPLPSTAVGITFYCQTVWVSTGGCSGAQLLSASDALRIDVSPP